jgi:putative ABC transport system permease protein
LRVTPEFFDVLGVKPMLGRAFDAGSADADREGVLIGYEHWRNRLGADPAVVGRPLAAATPPRTVLGVLPPGFAFFEGVPEVVSLLRPADLEAQPRTHYYYWVVGRLKPGVGVAQAEAELDGAMRRIAADFPIVRDWEVTVDRLDSLLAEPVRPALLSLLAAAALVLLIACTNVAHLLLARGLERRRELALRLALGASRWRISRQLLAESALLAGAGGLLGAGVAAWGVEALARLLPGEVAVAGSAARVALPPVEMDGVALAVAFGLTLVTVLLVGVLPTRAARSVQGHGSLGSARSTGDRREGRTRGALVAAETALATLALAMAGLMLRTVVELVRTDPGFRPEGVVSVVFGRVHDLEPEPRARYFEDVLRGAAAVPGVVAAALNDYVLLTNEDDYEGFEIEGRARPGTASWPREEWRRISPDYFRLTGTPLVRGRWFGERDDARAPSVVLVNQAFAAKHWPGEDPVGRRIRITHEAYGWSEVVGVVGDVREVALGKPAKPMMFVPYQRAPRPVMALFAKVAGDPALAGPALARAVWSVDPARPVLDVRPLNQVVRSSMSVQRLTLQLAAALAALAALLTAVGIHGVVRHAAGRRTREIGVRLAVGAQSADIFWLVVRQGAAPALMGLLLGLAGSRALARLFESQLYGVTGSDPATLAATALLVATVTLAACAEPARRAALGDPVAALRCE